MNGAAKIGDVMHLPLITQCMQKLPENYVECQDQSSIRHEGDAN